MRLSRVQVSTSCYWLDTEYTKGNEAYRARLLSKLREEILGAAVDKVTKGLSGRLKTEADYAKAVYIVNECKVTSWADPLCPDNKHLVTPHQGRARPMSSYVPPSLPSETVPLIAEA